MPHVSVRRLLSGASVIAIAAALAHTPAVAAGQTFTGNQAPIVISADTDFVNVTNATVAADGGGNSFIIQSGVTVTAPATTQVVLFDSSTFAGSVINNGRIIGGDVAAWSMQTSIILGDLDNNGFILGGGAAPGGASLTLQGVTISGSIHNTGTIQGSGNLGARALSISDSTIGGDIVNSGTIEGGFAVLDPANALSLDNTDVLGAIRNDSTGLLAGGSSITGQSNGLRIVNGSFVGGGIFNEGTIQSGVNSTVIAIDASTVIGGIHNDGGTITAAAGGYGLVITGSVITGGIANSGTITGSSDGSAVFVGTSTVTGAITNSGSISGRQGFSFGAANITGGLVNDGSILGNIDAIHIEGGVFANGIVNNGSIVGGGTTTGFGIQLAGGAAFSGGIMNSGLIKGDAGIRLNAGNLFSGGITNNAGGSIVGISSAAIQMSGGGTAVFSGGITNHGYLTSGLDIDAVLIDNVAFSGGIHNGSDGLIEVTGHGNAIDVRFGSFSGGLLNEGGIVAGNANAIAVTMTNFSGPLTNAGTITSNSIGILVQGLVGDGIFNSGTIEAPTAINIENASAGQTVTQTDGKILGDIVFSTLGESFFVGKGGYFNGNMQGSSGLNDDLTVVSGVWSAEGSAASMSDIFVTGGTGVFGGKFYGDLAGTGFDVVDTSQNFGTTAGRAFIDDDSNIDVANNASFGSEGTLEYLLTSVTGVHGVVSGGSDAFLDGRIAGYFAWNSFAGLGGTQDFTYLNVVTSGDLNGAFDNEGDVDTNSIFFTATATQRLDQFVDINAHRIGFDEILPAATGNQQTVGAALEEIFENGGAPFLALEDPAGDGLQNPQEDNEGLYSALFQLASVGDVAAAYSSLDGHINAAIFETTFTIADLLDNNIHARLDDAHNGAATSRWSRNEVRYAAASTVASDTSVGGLTEGRAGWSAWVRGFGSWGNADGDAFNEGFDQNSGGVGGGIDYATNGGSLIGLAVQFASTDLEFDRPWWATVGADANIDSWQVALYGSHDFGGLYLDGNANVTFNDYDTNRVDLLGQPITSSYDSTVYSIYGELGTILGNGSFRFQPFAGVGFRHADFDNFTETCPLFCLAVKPDDAESLYTDVGVRVSSLYHWGSMPVAPELRLAWQHEFSDHRGAFDAAFVGAGGVPFHVEGHEFSDDRFKVGAGITASLGRSLEAFVDYDGTFSSDFDEHSVSGGLRVTW